MLCLWVITRPFFPLLLPSLRIIILVPSSDDPDSFSFAVVATILSLIIVEPVYFLQLLWLSYILLYVLLIVLLASSFFWVVHSIVVWNLLRFWFGRALTSNESIKLGPLKSKHKAQSANCEPLLQIPYYLRPSDVTNNSYCLRIKLSAPQRHIFNFLSPQINYVVTKCLSWKLYSSHFFHIVTYIFLPSSGATRFQ